MSDSPKKGTVLSALMWASAQFNSVGIQSSRLDAEILLSEVLRLERIQLYLNFDRPMEKDEKNRFLSLVERRKGREPIAYIINRKEFMSLNFYVDRNVLIPRPETECMIEWIVENVSLLSDSRVLDIGTGSGCIAASLLKNTDISHIYASDIDRSALEVANKNLNILKGDKSFTLYNSSLFDKIDRNEFDLIVSNPPYIKSGDISKLMPEISLYEPEIALNGGADGCKIIKRLVSDSLPYLKKDGYLVFEHAEDFSMEKSLIENRYQLVFCGKDYSQRNRFTVLKKIQDY